MKSSMLRVNSCIYRSSKYEPVSVLNPESSLIVATVVPNVEVRAPRYRPHPASNLVSFITLRTSPQHFSAMESLASAAHVEEPGK